MHTTHEQLAAMAREGDKAAAEQLLRQVSGFASATALRYLPLASSCGMGADDLCQCAALGVLEAIPGYRAEKGAFLTWCAFFIRRQCLSALGLTGRPRLEHYRRASLDAPLSPEEDSLTLLDCLPDAAAAASFDAVEERCWLETLHRDITEALDRLAGQEGYVIRRHDLEGAGYKAIGAELGLEVPRVQQRRKAGLAHLRKDRVLRRLYQPNYWRHKGVAAFNTTFSSVVEDEAIRHLDNERRDETP